jgi:hypothetical protein
MTRRSQKSAPRTDDGSLCNSEDGRPLRAIECFDFRPCEVEWLNILRTMLARQADPTNETWANLHERADRKFGRQAGPLILGATSGLIRALKLEKPEPFYFVSPGCATCRERLCEDEFLVLCAVVSCRCGDTEEMHLAISQLTQEQASTRLVQAVQSLAALINMVPEPSAALWQGAAVSRVLH